MGPDSTKYNYIYLSVFSVQCSYKNTVFKAYNQETKVIWFSEDSFVVGIKPNDIGFVECHLICINQATSHSQIAKFMGPTWGPPRSCHPQMGPMLALWTLLSGLDWLPVASFTEEVNPQLAKRPLKNDGRLANCGLTSLVKEAPGDYWRFNNIQKCIF